MWRADPDGWCLLACVERALGGADRTLLLQQALHVISEGGVLGAQAEQQAAANEMLLVATQSSQRQPNQKVAKLWDSDVWDAMPAALSRVVGRSLHIGQRAQWASVAHGGRRGCRSGGSTREADSVGPRVRLRALRPGRSTAAGIGVDRCMA